MQPALTIDPEFRNRGIKTVAVLGVMAVSLGALGAHWLKNQIGSGTITVDQVAGFDTGVKYQMYHLLAMLCLLSLPLGFHPRFLRLAYYFFLWGIVLFSGSLYLLCTKDITGMVWLRVLGPVTPLGGLLFIAGWVCLFLSVVKKTN